MASINSITITGRAGKDPEVRYHENGSAVATVEVAVDRFGIDKATGEKRKPLWIKVSIWGKSAQIAADYVRKGSMVGITGRLDVETWNDRNSGQERSKPVINANDLILLSSQGSQGSQVGRASTGAGEQQAQGWGSGSDLSDEIPF